MSGFLIKKPTALILIFAVIVLVIGVPLYYSKQYFARQLFSLLEDEIKNSCDCQLTHGDIDLSLLSLTAVAKDARLLEHGVEKLSVKTIVASFGISEILSHNIRLERIDLIGAHAIGVTEDSATYKLIDYLSAPIAPEKDRPGRWKVKLISLTLQDSSFEEPINDFILHGTGAFLLMNRTPGGDYRLEPRIKELMLADKSSPQTAIFSLGGAKSDLIIYKNNVKFQTLTLERPGSLVTASGASDTLNDNALSGAMQLECLNLETVIPNQPVRGDVCMQGDLEGNIARPESHGKFQTSALSVPINGLPFAPFESVSGDYDLKSIPTNLKLANLQGNGAGISLQGGAFETDFSQIQGEAIIKVDNIAVSSSTLSDSEIKVKLEGSARNPLVTVDLSSPVFAVSDTALSDLVGKATYQNRKLNFTAQSTDAALKAEGALTLNENSDFIFDSATARLEGFPFGKTAINADVNIKPGSALKEPAGKGSFSLISNFEVLPLSLFGSINFDKDALTIEGADEKKSLFVKSFINLSEDLKPNTLAINAENFSIPQNSPVNNCSSFSFKTNYSFPPSGFAQGSGDINLEKASVGCAPFEISLLSKSSFRIKQGAIDLANASLEAANSKLALSGSLSFANGYNIGANGELPLDALLIFTPSLDELSGNINISAKISGALNQPHISGGMTVKDGILAQESTGIELTNATGDISLSNDSFSVEKLSGKINGGDFTLAGEGSLFNGGTNSLNLNFQDAVFQPTQNLFGVTSGALKLIHTAGATPTIEGEVAINNAELRQNIDLKAIVDAIASLVLSSTATAVSNRSAPDIALNIKVTAPSNLFVLTNWLEAELGSSLTITGTLAEPKISGKMFTNSGWFGVKERKFTINSGELVFTPDSKLPTVSVSGESTLLTRNGERVTVFVDVSGSLETPKVSFSSDRGYSQQEILSLITSGYEGSQRSNRQTFGFGVDYEDISLLDKDSSLKIEEFLYNLTKIDSLTVQPSYNSLTGTLEPSVVAEKRLTENLTLKGEGIVSGNITASELSAAYRLSKSLSLQSSLNSASNERKASAGVDLAYTILSENPPRLRVDLAKEASFTSSQLLSFARASELTSLLASEVPRLIHDIEKGVRDQGYLNAVITGECVQTEFCRRIKLAVDQGTEFSLRSVVVTGEGVEAVLPPKKAKKLEKLTKATKKYREEVLQEVTRYLRSEGYISARVSGDYQPVENSEEVDLLLEVSLGSPVTFIFSGNKVFNDYELLESINLFKRKHPFGNNSIKILIDAIEQKYREAGYLYSTIDYRQDKAADGRTIYYVNIVEEEPVRVIAVIFEGNNSISTKKLLKDLKKGNFPGASDIMVPKRAIDEELQQNANSIKQLYVQHGFSEAKVDYDLAPNEDGKGVIIRYLIQEGPQLLVKELKYEGLPGGFIPPKEKARSLSVPEAQTKGEETVTRLIESGYHQATFTQSFDPESHAMTFTITPGFLTKIGEIKITGNTYVKSSLISEHLTFASGETYDDEKINFSKRKLLKLGLFSKIEIVPTDGAIDSETEDVTVKVAERSPDAITVGAGVNSTYGLHLFGEALNREFFADGQTLALKADIYLDSSVSSLSGGSNISQGSANFLYTNPQILDTDFSWVEELRFQRETALTQEFDVIRTGLSSYFYRSWDSGATFSFGHTLAVENLNNVSPGAIIGDFDSGNVTLGFLNGSFKFDRRDNPLNPRSGYVTLLDYKYAAPALGSDANFFETSGRASVTHPFSGLFKRFSLALSSRIGEAWGFGNTDQIPITQRFYLGGRTTVRGFKENSLGPKGFDGSVIGGDVMQANSLELQYLVAEYTSVHSFLDTGNVYLRSQDVSLNDQRVSTGVGVQYLSPIGPIGFDLGHPLDRKPGEARFRFHFSIGTSF
jgi:outer membrane protein insertion porin family